MHRFDELAVGLKGVEITSQDVVFLLRDNNASATRNADRVMYIDGDSSKTLLQASKQFSVYNITIALLCVFKRRCSRQTTALSRSAVTVRRQRQILRPMLS
jgi:hypothetical protein